MYKFAVFGDEIFFNREQFGQAVISMEFTFDTS